VKIIKFFNKKQKGIALPISLFVLIGVLLAAGALMRSGDLSVNVAGDIGTRAQIASSNDSAVSIAVKWLVDNSASLTNDSLSNGYNSSIPNGYIDYTKDNTWEANVKTLSADSLGNVSTYQIYRMCSLSNVKYNGSAGAIQNSCATSVGTSTTGSTSSMGYNSYNFSQSFQGIMVFYKIVTKTEGSKGSKVITETMIKVIAS